MTLIWEILKQCGWYFLFVSQFSSSLPLVHLLALWGRRIWWQIMEKTINRINWELQQNDPIPLKFPVLSKVTGKWIKPCPSGKKKSRDKCSKIFEHLLNFHCHWGFWWRKKSNRQLKIKINKIEIGHFNSAKI